MVDKENDEPDQLFCTVNYNKSKKKEEEEEPKVQEMAEQNNGTLPPQDFIFDEQAQIDYRNSKKANN